MSLFNAVQTGHKTPSLFLSHNVFISPCSLLDWMFSLFSSLLVWLLCNSCLFCLSLSLYIWTLLSQPRGVVCAGYQSIIYWTIISPTVPAKLAILADCFVFLPPYTQINSGQYSPVMRPRYVCIFHFLLFKVLFRLGAAGHNAHFSSIYCSKPIWS